MQRKQADTKNVPGKAQVCNLRNLSQLNIVRFKKKKRFLLKCSQNTANSLLSKYHRYLAVVKLGCSETVHNFPWCKNSKVLISIIITKTYELYSWCTAQEVSVTVFHGYHDQNNLMWECVWLVQVTYSWIWHSRFSIP